MGSKNNTIKTAIDIGSNTVLLLVGWVKNGKIGVLYEEQHAPRLGKGVDAHQNLDQASTEEVIKVLNKYKSVLDEDFSHADKPIVTATSAVRDAANKESFIRRVRQETRFRVQVLSGAEEARYTFFGATSVLEERKGSICVLDIGGGSTEVAIGSKNLLKDRFSYDTGSVRFTERYLRDDPPTEIQCEECQKASEDMFKQRIFHFPSNFKLVGVAGTVTSLAHIDAGLSSYSPNEINGKILSLEDICSWIEKLKKLTSNQLLERHPAILKGRADVFLGGLIILESFMKSCQINEIVVSTGGIRHGALIVQKK